MAKVIVSLVSDQTIPNVLFIREMQNKIKSAKHYIFITTKDMENKKKTSDIINGSNIKGNDIETVEVVEYKIDDINEKLRKVIDMYDDGDEFIVNLTGGTKIMSIAVYNFFKERGAKIYYLPIGENVYRQIYPVVKSRDRRLNFRINVDDYLRSYGIEIVNEDKPLMPRSYTNSFFKMFLQGKIGEYSYNEITEGLRQLRNSKAYRRKGKYPISSTVASFLRAIDFHIDGEYMNRQQISYLTGGWFEEYVYTLVKKELQLEDEYIKLSMNIKKNDVPNEFDVMFTYENTLYVIECKTSLKAGNRSIINEALYKLAALKRNFGLLVKSYLFTLDNIRDKDGNIKDTYKNRAYLFGIRIVDRVSLSGASINIKNILFPNNPKT